ncbi:MAG: hypothetical protein SF029_02995 [bacterium]|nr:hypothetical protein [bacterium]
MIVGNSIQTRINVANSELSQLDSLISTVQDEITATEWCCSFNFPSGQKGWDVINNTGSSGEISPRGTYTSGQGFKASSYTATDVSRVIHIRRLISSDGLATQASIISVKVFYDADCGYFDAGNPLSTGVKGRIVLTLPTPSTTQTFSLPTCIEGTDLVFEWSNPASPIIAAQITVDIVTDRTDNRAAIGSATIKRIEVRGTGTNPFSTGSCG